MSGTLSAEQLTHDLTAAGVDARRAGDADVVDGVAAALVATPRDTASTAAVLRLAAERRLAVVARGTGTKLSWGVPPKRLDILLDTSAMNAVVEHAAGDLVVHAQAGIRLDALQQTLAAAGQRLAVDPLVGRPDAGPGTVGGTIATAASGPLRLSHGAVRDLLIGVTFVRADGTVAKAGGKVVKNVAGYDLSKLLTGSWGTLGVITEAVFRLHPVPAAFRWLVRETADAREVQRDVQAVVQSQLVPSALEIDRSPDGHTAVAVLVEGMTDAVERRAARVGELLPDSTVDDRPPAWWGRLPGGPGDTVLRVTHEIAGLPGVLAALDACGVPAAVRGSAGVGLLHAALAGPAGEVAAAVTRLRAAAAAWSGDVVVLDARPEIKAGLDPWGPVRGLELMHRIKAEFDPDRTLAPGRFVGGI